MTKSIGLCSGFGQFHSANNSATPEDYKIISLAEIEALTKDPPSVAKEKAQWVIFSTLPSRVHAEQRKDGLFYALWADIDETEGKTFIDIVSLSQGAIPEADFLAYSSRSATKDNQKLRLIVPLAEPVDGLHFVILQTILNDKLKAAGITPDIATQRVGQICYLPNKGKFYESHIERYSGSLNHSLWTEEIEKEKQRLKDREEELQRSRKNAQIKAAERMASGCKSPIDAFNAEYSLPLMLETYGYIRRRNRWLSPNSESSSSGVTITSDGLKWLSSHGSDSEIGKETTNGTMGDAFDLFTYYQHNGDRNAAIKASGEMFTIEGTTLTKLNQREYMQAQDMPELAGGTTREKGLEDKSGSKSSNIFDLPEFPPELLVLPAHLGKLQDYIYNRMTYPSLAAAGMTALSTLTSFAQTNITIDSRDGLGFNEYYLFLMPTGFGKEDLRKPPETLQRLADVRGFDSVTFRSAMPASQQGIHQLVMAKRSIMFLADEYAEWVRQTHKDATKQAAQGYMMQAYSKALSVIEPGHAVTTNYEPVRLPRLSIMATSTAEAIFETLTKEQADSGAYNRLVIFSGDTELPEKRYDIDYHDPDQSLVDFFTWVIRLPETCIKITEDGYECFKHLDQEFGEPIKKKDPQLGGRLAEQAIKFAGLHALSDKRLFITGEDMQRAFAIRIGLYKRSAKQAHQIGSLDGLHHTNRAKEQVIEVLLKVPEIYRSQIKVRSRRFKKLNIIEQKLVIESLIADGYMEQATGRKVCFNSLIFEENKVSNY